VTKIPTSLWSRGSKLVGMASKVALNEIGTKLKTWESDKDRLASRLEMAHTLVKTMSELKGASMKLGQLISMDLGEYFPPEVVKILETLHQQSTFLPYNQIHEILKSELQEKLNDIKNISPGPIAAASIGQVHSATLNGEDIVIKIQYPGVAESIPSDLKMLELLLKNLAFFQGKQMDLAPFFQEVKEVLERETDYLHEAQMLERYQAAFRDTSFIIPRLYKEYSTNKIIIMEKINGVKLTDWIEKSFLGERQKLAHDFMTLYLKEFFQHGLVQTDPNPGNFLMASDNRMALLDFGAVKEYDQSFIDGYRRVLKSALENNLEELITTSEAIGFIDAREPEEVKKLYLAMMETLAAPFRSNQPFDFNDKNFYDMSRDQSWELTKKCRYSPPPKDLLFLHRKLGGVFFLIKKLDVKLVLKDYWHLVEN
jgi:aarF domain-containing kinase